MKPAPVTPLAALTLVAGETADRYDRRRTLTFCYLAQLLTAAGLAVSRWWTDPAGDFGVSLSFLGEDTAA